MIAIYNEDCFVTMKRFSKGDINMILTSPPYNTSRKSNKPSQLKSHQSRYDVHLDNKTPAEYRQWCVDLFNEFDKILSENGVILWNVSYSNDATEGMENIATVWNTLSDIIDKTNFIIADHIVWKKKSALPNNRSSNRLTRIIEDIYVFCRKDEIKTFQCNKAVKSVSKVGLNYYENIYNFIEAPNNDGSNPYNKATYSTELCEKLLTIYAIPGTVVYDPFMGTGTTANACKNMSFDCYGSEISKNQVNYANERLGIHKRPLI